MNELVHEREALEELIHSEGWREYVRHVTHEWTGEGFFARMSTAFGTGVEEAKIVHRVALELQRSLVWPRERVHELKGVVEE